MQPGTVLAGAIEFSPAEIAFFLIVLALAALVLSAPGWVVLGHVCRRRAAARGATRAGRGWAWAGGALLGLAVSAVVSSLVGAVLDDGRWLVPTMVVASWAGCWGLAGTLRPRAAGWGR